MIAFFKTCLKGFLTILLSPLWAAVFVLSGLFSLFLFFYVAVKEILALMTRNHHGIYDTAYDKKAQEILSNPNYNPAYGIVLPAPVYYPPYQGAYPPAAPGAQYFPPSGSCPASSGANYPPEGGSGAER